LKYKFKRQQTIIIKEDTMGNNTFEDRLAQLKTQYDAGQKELDNMRKKENDLQVTLLRISGAVQVLEEELSKMKQSQQ
jgi:predicted  nucleic acid-binding Zn-ribbon protein